MSMQLDCLSFISKMLDQSSSKQDGAKKRVLNNTSEIAYEESNDEDSEDEDD